MNIRKHFTRPQIPGGLIMAGTLAYAIYAGHWAGWLIGVGSFYAGLIGTLELVKWHGRRTVRRILAEKPHLAYLIAIRQELNGKDN